MQGDKEPKRRERNGKRAAFRMPQPSILDIDPEDPSQVLDEAGAFSVVLFEVEAQPHAEADADLEAAVEASAADEAEEAETRGDQDAQELDTPSQTTSDAYVEAADDTGDLYGVHSPRPAEKLEDGDDAYDDSELGENWIETLGKKAAEIGAEAEQELDVVDDSDSQRGHSSTDRRDRPVADKGSGGEGGM